MSDALKNHFGNLTTKGIIRRLYSEQERREYRRKRKMIKQQKSERRISQKRKKAPQPDEMLLH